MYKRTLSIACLFGLLLTVIEAKPASTCLEKSKDILFVLDSSKSIEKENYIKQLNFVAEVVDGIALEHRKREARIALITFSDRAYLEFRLNQYLDREELKRAISKIRYRTGNTNTAEALKLVRYQVEPIIENRKTPIVTIVITDGGSTDPGDTKVEATKLRKLGILVYAIGVGYRYNIDELRTIASDPINNVYTVSTYSALKEISEKLHTRPCGDENSTTTTTQTPPGPTCINGIPRTTTDRSPRRGGVKHPADESSIIIFGYDIGSPVNMIHQFINRFLQYSGYEYFSAISHAFCLGQLNMPITYLLNKEPLELETILPVHAVIPGLAEIVRQMNKQFQMHAIQNAGVRLKTNQVAVLFIDPLFTIITPELIKETQKLKDNGVKLFVINVGNAEWFQPQNLQFISSYPLVRYLYNIPTYEQLLYNIRMTPVLFKDMCNVCTPNSLLG